MPLDQFGWATIPPPPQPPVTLWPGQTMPQLIVDTWGVCLADPSGNLIGLPVTAGPPAVVQGALLTRAMTRAL